MELIATYFNRVIPICESISSSEQKASPVPTRNCEKKGIIKLSDIRSSNTDNALRKRPIAVDFFVPSLSVNNPTGNSRRKIAMEKIEKNKMMFSDEKLYFSDRNNAQKGIMQLNPLKKTYR